MGIKDILNKHIYKNKHLKNRPDPRPTYIFPPGTYVAPISQQQQQQQLQQPACNAYCYQNNLDANQNVQSRPGFRQEVGVGAGIGMERFQFGQHLYVNENLYNSGSAYDFDDRKSRNDSAHSIRSFHSHGSHLQGPQAPHNEFLRRNASSQSIRSQYEPRESRSRTVRNDSRGAYAVAESESRFSDLKANASSSHHSSSSISTSRSPSRARSSALASPISGSSQDIIIEDYNSFEKHIQPHQRFRRDPDGSMHNIYGSESTAKSSTRNNYAAAEAKSAQISVPAFNGQLAASHGMKGPSVPLSQLPLNRLSDRESEYIVIKGSVVYDSGYVYE